MSHEVYDPPEQRPPSKKGEHDHPPRKWHSRKSGSLAGKPKNRKSRRKIVAEVATEMHTVIENGIRRRRSTLELVVLRLRNMALEGPDQRGFQELHRLIKIYSHQGSDEPAVYVYAPDGLTIEEWVAKFGGLKKINEAT